MEGISFFPLLIISGLAFVVPVIASRFPGGMIPIVVAEILAGVAFGRAGLGFIHVDENIWLAFLSQFGFAYLMLLSGLEVDFGLLSRLGGEGSSRMRMLLDNPLVMGLGIFLLTLIGAGIGAWLLLGDVPLSHILLFGLILSTTSVGIVVPTLKERGLTRRPFGQVILMSAMVADFATILLITVLAGILANDNIFRISLVAMLFGLFFIVTRVGARVQFHRFVRRPMEELAHATGQIGVRGAMALMVVFVVLAEAVEAELVLGAFLAGTVISSLSREEGSSLRVKLDAIGYGFFVPVFFITVGADFNLDALRSSPSSLLLVPALIAIAYAVKVVPSLILKTRYSLRQSLSAGILLSSRLSLIIAASVIGLRLGVIDEATNASLILVAIVTSTVSPALFTYLFPRPKTEQGRAIIVGAGQLGMMLSDRLTKEGMKSVIVEIDYEKAQSAREQGLEVVNGDGLSIEVLAIAGTLGATAFIPVTSDDETNLKACLLAQENFNVDNVVARVNAHERVGEFERAGIKPVSRPVAIAIAMDNLVLRPDIFRVLAEPASQNEFLEVPLLNSRFVGHPVDQIHLPGDALIVLVLRDGLSFVPHPATILEHDDLLTIAGDRESVEEARRQLRDRNGLATSS
ncbi:MAG: monovalent cation:proton antiporter family protein [Chloroflexi bacterium]|nr:monovalent cation:proton antiporter family protein [Chloroflexota bacterium]